MGTRSGTEVGTQNVTSLQGEGMLEGTEEDAESVATVLPQAEKHFGGLGPREAARLRWAKERARQADAAEQEIHERSGEVALVRVTVPTGDIIKRLSADAKKGSTQAARELRAWLTEVQVETDTDASSLDRRTRQRLMARLLEELEVEDAAQANPLEGTLESTQPAITSLPVGHEAGEVDADVSARPHGSARPPAPGHPPKRPESQVHTPEGP